MQQAISYIEKNEISKADILAIITDVWNWDMKVKEFNEEGISDCIPLSFILQKNLGIWTEGQLFHDV